MKTRTLRELFQIQFKVNFNHLLRFWDINEPVKTLKEAQSYETMIDKTVSKARIVDTVTEKIIEIWR